LLYGGLYWQFLYVHQRWVYNSRCTYIP
jgi:hypothetical protein